ncbi:MAG: C40 family peptidase [Paludibacteraceae bacterium]|nr:C40 family peptidase [Paludibacteraceae bacterium]
MKRGHAILVGLLLLCGLYTVARNRAERLAPPASVQTAQIDNLLDDEARLEDPDATAPSAAALTAQQIVDYARNYLGKPYKYGGMTPDGFDCSGYTCYVFSHFGYRLPHRSLWQYEQVEKLDADDLRPGDLVFFAGSKGGNDINHVGIVTTVLPRGEFEFIHAASTGIVISSSRQNYYAERYIGAGRMLK